MTTVSFMAVVNMASPMRPAPPADGPILSRQPFHSGYVTNQSEAAQAVKSVLHVVATVPQPAAEPAPGLRQRPDVTTDGGMVNAVDGVQLAQRPAAGKGGQQVGERGAGVGREAALRRRQLGEEPG